MDGGSFKARLKLLGRTQTAFAAELGVALRTVHYWASDGPPNGIAQFLDVLTITEMPFGPAGADPAAFRRAVEAEMERLLSTLVPEREGEFLDVLSTWVGKRRRTNADDDGLHT